MDFAPLSNVGHSSLLLMPSLLLEPKWACYWAAASWLEAWDFEVLATTGPRWYGQVEYVPLSSSSWSTLYGSGHLAPLSELTGIFVPSKNPQALFLAPNMRRAHAIGGGACSNLDESF